MSLLTTSLSGVANTTTSKKANDPSHSKEDKDFISARNQRNQRHKALKEKDFITSTATEVGFGTKVYLREDLAEIEKCKSKDRCWLVGLSSRKSFAECLENCIGTTCTPKCARHNFSDAFYKHVGLERPSK
jgi:hypothetical protein